MRDSEPIDDVRAPLVPVPHRERAGRRIDRIAGGIVVALVVMIVVVLVMSREDGGSVETDAPPEQLLEAAAENLARAGSVRFRTEGEVGVTPEAGELAVDALAVQAEVHADGEQAVGVGSRLGVDFQVTGGPLPPELGPSHVDYVRVAGATWTRIEGEGWEETDVSEGVIDLPRFDAPDELLELAIRRGDDLRVAETTNVDGVEAHRVALRLTAADVGVRLEASDATVPVHVDLYVADDDSRLLRLDVTLDGAAPDPVPAQLALRLRTTYTDHGGPVDITPPA